MKGIEFLDVVWGERKGWISLPARTNGRWIERNYLWPESREVVETILSGADAGEEDTYFSVLQFKTRGRKEANAIGAAWLWADLDEVNPGMCAQHGLSPTWVWETSDGRYQGLWSLDRRLKTTGLAKLNRALTVKLGADPGGWDLTQVLRVPGVRNWKRGGKDVVRLVGGVGAKWDAKYMARVLAPLVGDASGSTEDRVKSTNGSHAIPPRARALLRATDAVAGERSARLWELECLLAEAGLAAEDIFGLVKESVWYEHWRERGAGAERGCRREIAKAIAKVSANSRNNGEAATHRGGGDGETGHSANGQDGQGPTSGASRDDGGGNRGSDRQTEQSVERLPIESYGRFLSRDLEAPRWLVDGIWTAESHGIIGGEPKTSKSLIALSLALCVATGKSWMKKYKTFSSGPALVIQEENTPWLTQDRLRKLARYHGLIGTGTYQTEAPGDAAQRLRIKFPRDYPLNIVNNFGTSLYEESHRDMIESAVQQTAARLLVLDPLYLMADESTSSSLRGVLQWLLWLRYEYKCAIIVVHHFKKTDTAPGAMKVQHGQRLLGSMTLHAWLESALYCEKREMSGAWMQTRVHREFRNVGPRAPVDLKVLIGEPGTLDFDVVVGQVDRTDEVLEAVKLAGVKGTRLAGLVKDLSMDKRTVIRILGALMERKMVVIETSETRRGNAITTVRYNRGKVSASAKSA